MKRLLSALLLVLILSSTVLAADGQVGLIINGRDMSWEKDKPILRQDRILVPLRLLAENNDYKVGWNGQTREVKLTKQGQSIVMKIGSANYRVNNEPKTMGVVPIIYKNRTYLPGRFVGEAMGKKVDWDPKNRVAIIGLYGQGSGPEAGKEEFILPGTKVAINLPKGFRDQIVFRWDDFGRVYVFADKKHVTRKNEFGGDLGSFIVSDDLGWLNPIHKILDFDNGTYTFINISGDQSWDHRSKELTDSYKKSSVLFEEALRSAHRVN